jgi:hypothetical protein
MIMMRQLLRNIYKFTPRTDKKVPANPKRRRIWNLSVLRQHYLCGKPIGIEKTFKKNHAELPASDEDDRRLRIYLFFNHANLFWQIVWKQSLSFFLVHPKSICNFNMYVNRTMRRMDRYRYIRTPTSKNRNWLFLFFFPFKTRGRVFYGGGEVCNAPICYVPLLLLYSQIHGHLRLMGIFRSMDTFNPWTYSDPYLRCFLV